MAARAFRCCCFCCWRRCCMPSKAGRQDRRPRLAKRLRRAGLAITSKPAASAWSIRLAGGTWAPSTAARAWLSPSRARSGRRRSGTRSRPPRSTSRNITPAGQTRGPRRVARARRGQRAAVAGRRLINRVMTPPRGGDDSHAGTDGNHGWGLSRPGCHRRSAGTGESGSDRAGGVHRRRRCSLQRGFAMHAGGLPAIEAGFFAGAEELERDA